MGRPPATDRLPLPADVGEAIVAYLRRGRPAKRSSRVVLACEGAVHADRAGNGRLDRASRVPARRDRGGRRRTGCGTRPRARCSGRERAAAQIGQVLRHHSLQTTAIYARVDLDQLRQLADAVARGASDEHARAASSRSTCGCAATLGYKLERHGQVLSAADHLSRPARREHDHQRVGDRVGEVNCRRACPRYWANRLGAARGFAAYLKTIDSETEIPPAGVFAGGYRRPAPYLWSQQDISRLLDAARALRPALKAATTRRCSGCWRSPACASARPRAGPRRR